jgi:hypothetical protein
VEAEVDDCQIQTRRRTSPRLSIAPPIKNSTNLAVASKHHPVLHGLNEAFFNATNSSLSNSIPSSGSQNHHFSNSPSKKLKHNNSSNSSIISIDDDDDEESSQPRGSTQIVAAATTRMGTRKQRQNSQQSLVSNSQGNTLISKQSQQFPLFLDCSSILADSSSNGKDNNSSSTTDNSSYMLNSKEIQKQQPSMINNTIEIDKAEVGDNHPIEDFDDIQIIDEVTKEQAIAEKQKNQVKSSKQCGELHRREEDLNNCDSSSEMLMALMVVNDTQPFVNNQNEAAAAAADASQSTQKPAPLAVSPTTTVSNKTDNIK